MTSPFIIQIPDEIRLFLEKPAVAPIGPERPDVVRNRGQEDGHPGFFNSRSRSMKYAPSFARIGAVADRWDSKSAGISVTTWLGSKTLSPANSSISATLFSGLTFEDPAGSFPGSGSR